MQNFNSQADLRRGNAMLAPRHVAPAMKLVKFTPVPTGGSLLAYHSVELPSGLILNDLKLMRGPQGGFWVAMPSMKQLDRDGNPVLDERGKPRYRNYVDFRDKGVRDKFGEQVLDLVRREHPDIVGDA